MSIIPDTKTAMDPKDMKAMFAEWVINRMRLKHTDANRIAVNNMVFSTTDVMEFTQHLLRRLSPNNN